MMRAALCLLAALPITARACAAQVSTAQLPSAEDCIRALAAAPAWAEDVAGNRRADLVVRRSWQGGRCVAALENRSNRAVAVERVVLASWKHGLSDRTSIYGEGLQMLSQTGGTLAAPVDEGYLTDRGHYKIALPEGASAVVYGALMLGSADPGAAADPPAIPVPLLLLGFSSCRRFTPKFELWPERIDVVLECEGLELAAGASWELEELMVLSGDHRDQLFAELAARISANHPPRFPDTPPSGWCSWYCFGPRATAEDIRSNLSWLSEHAPALRYVQIDDGYQAAMGDWTTTGDAFGGGVHEVLREIREVGFEPAIWVAPFIAQEDSQLFREHPDWFVKAPDGSPLRSSDVSFGGWRFGPWYCLDGTHPEVQVHYRELFRLMREDWGCSYFKLDATFWGMMHGGSHHDPDATRVEAYRRGMQAILDGAEDAFVLGCNHPIWPSFGLIDGSRSSMDVGRKWGNFRRTGRENLLRNWQNGRLWWNDPDCLLLTGELSDAEFQYHASLLHATGGMLLSGDDLPQLSEGRAAMLKQLAAPTGVPASFADHGLEVGVMELDGEQRVFFFNATDQPASRGCELDQLSQVHDFWTGEDLGPFRGRLELELPPRSARVLRCAPLGEPLASPLDQDHSPG